MKSRANGNESTVRGEKGPDEPIAEPWRAPFASSWFTPMNRKQKDRDTCKRSSNEAKFPCVRAAVMNLKCSGQEFEWKNHSFSGFLMLDANMAILLLSRPIETRPSLSYWFLLHSYQVCDWAMFRSSLPTTNFEQSCHFQKYCHLIALLDQANSFIHFVWKVGLFPSGTFNMST